MEQGDGGGAALKFFFRARIAILALLIFLAFAAAGLWLRSRPGLTAEVPRAGLIAPETNQAPSEAREPRNWKVQVGEFRSGAQATHQIDYVADSFKSMFDDREGQVEHAGRVYRAIFTGFTQSEARTACQAVQAQGQACLADPR